ncbi:MAG: BatA domain-containing protein [Bacteroidia bacterium]
MQFVYPTFLFALASLSIPIIIHLFNFRKFKTVYFTNVRFLKEVKEETQAKSRLKHLLVLFARLLALTFLILAFAQPFIPRSQTLIPKGAKAVSVYIDNSFSMDAENKSGRLLDEARKAAREIASSYKPTDQFQLLTNDFEGRHQRLLNREEFLENVEEVKLSPALRNLSEITSRQAEILIHSGAPRGAKIAFIISDFQKSTWDAEKLKNDTSVSYHLVPVKAEEQKNLYVDSCWFDSPVRKLNRPEYMHVRIRNASAQEYVNVPMKLFINGQQKTPSSFSIGANAKVDTVIAFTVRETGWQDGRVEITDSPITFDDIFYFSYRISKTLPVLSIAPASAGKGGVDPVSNLFKKDSAFSYTSVNENAVDYSSLAHNSLIVTQGLNTISSGLSQELTRFVQNGGCLLLFPSGNADPVSYNTFFDQLHLPGLAELDTARMPVEQLNSEQEIYKEGVFEKKNAGAQKGPMDLPLVFRHFRLNRSSHSTEEYLMKLRNGEIFLAKYASGKGNVYLCTAPLNDGSNFTKHALFVPTLLQIAFFSQTQNRLFYTIGSNDVVELLNANTSGENVFHISSSELKADIIPEHRIIDSKTEIYVRNQINKAGNYVLSSNTEKIQSLSFNYDRRESDIRTFQTSELKLICEKAGWINFNTIETGGKGLQAGLADIDQGRKLWKFCVMLCLLFLAAEVMLLRWFK